MTDEHETFDLSRRSVLAGLGGVGLASAGAGLGTAAYLNDTESFDGNTIAAGELDLKVDWQQRYFGPEDDSFPAYGTAGYPWVNAHPDEDADGIQSLDSDNYDSVPDDGVVTYEDQGRNIQEYLTCETLDGDYDFGPNDRSLVELDDVKPGDSGEITFSYHLCDNPGFVFFCADLVEAAENGNPEPEENHSEDTGPADETTDDPTTEDNIELLDEIRVQTWYDVDCDNAFDDIEDILVGNPTSLRSFLSAFEDADKNCVLLDPTAYPGISTPGSEMDCLELGTVDFTTNGLEVVGDGQVIRVEEGNSGDSEDNLEVWVNLKDTANSENAVVRFSELETPGQPIISSDGDLTDVTEFDWDVIEPVSAGGNIVVGNVGSVDGDEFESSDIGMCESVLTDSDGTSTTANLVGNSCSRGEDDVRPRNGLYSPSVDTFTLSYCVPGTGGPMPFPSSATFCLGFEWMLPEDAANEIQSDSVSFDLGFYTEQARNNEAPGQTL